MEILQLALQKPQMAILDETDSGLDIDALRVVANGVNAVAGHRHGRADHHPLPADPAPRAAEPRARHVPGADRQARAAPSWSTSSRPRATAGSPTRSTRRPMTATAAVDARRRRRRRAVPGPAPRAVDGRRSSYLDSAATSQTPQAVIDAIDDVLHAAPRLDPPRRVPARGQRRPTCIEGARERIAAGSVDAARRRSSPPTRPRRSTSSRTRGGARTCRRGDLVVLTEMEHHSNIVPWQLLVPGSRGRDSPTSG